MIYGSFRLWCHVFKTAPPLYKYTDAILYHHTAYQALIADQKISLLLCRLAKLIHFADFIDILQAQEKDIEAEIKKLKHVNSMKNLLRSFKVLIKITN